MVKDIGRELDMRGPEQDRNPNTSLDKGVHSFASATSVRTPPIEAPAPPEIKERPEIKKTRKGLSKAARIGISTTAILIGIEGVGALVNEQVNQQPVSAKSVISDFAWPWNLGKSAVKDIKDLFNKQKQILHEGTLAPQPGESAPWWQELPLEEIQKLADVPGINMIGDEYISTVSPVLQEKAQQAGYEIIYQGDPNDTTGRTVVVKGRQLINEDLGFGLDGDGFNIKGVFKYWVPSPNDPNQQKQIYAVLENPITNVEYTIAVELFPDTGGNERTTWLAVDDLNIGINDVNKRAQEQGGYKDSTYLLPDLNAPAGAPHKKVTDFPTVNDLVRKQALNLTELIAPGDYVAAILQTAGTPTDSNGVKKALLLTVRRFGGTTK